MWALPEQKTYDPALACIYCGKKDCLLTEEHIIPRAIGGRLLFPNASCDGCQKIINEQFEGSVLGFILKSLRAQLGLKSRKKPIPKTLRVASYKMEENGSFPKDMREADFKWEDIDLEKYPPIIVHVKFERPGFLIGAEPSHLFVVKDISVYTKEIDKAEKSEHEKALNISTMEPFSPDRFCRTVAKIAHGAAVAHFPKDSFTQYLPKIILGEDRNISYFVGGDGKKSRGRKQLHSIKFQAVRGLLLAYVTLFAKYDGPTYEVVVGESSPELSKWSMSEEFTLLAPSR